MAISRRSACAWPWTFDVTHVRRYANKQATTIKKRGIGMKRLLFTCLVATFVSSSAVVVCASDCCERCGCQQHCRKVCRVVCDTKDVKETCYSLVCEDYCLHGPPPCCTKSKCGGCSDCATATCGPVRTRAKLVKREITRKVPVAKCVVETLCNGCCGQGAIPKTARLETPLLPAAVVPDASSNMPAPPEPLE
jgi:hypothetical protein